MSETFDHLSIEELQSQLVQIQRRIQEKEKQQVIEKITDLLKSREPAYVHTVLAFVEGKRVQEVRERAPLPPPSREEEKPKKEGAYLRNGKVFFGIQEIKFTKYDKNQVLRISKEGKGLPPRVDAFPDEIRDALLALPVRTEIPPAPSVSDMDTVVDERCQPGPTITETEPAPVVEDASEPAVEVEPEPVVDAQPEPLVEVVPESTAAATESEPEAVTQVAEPATAFLEVPLDAELDETQGFPDPTLPSDPVAPARSGRKAVASKAASVPRIKPEPLQASLF